MNTSASSSGPRPNDKPPNPVGTADGISPFTDSVASGRTQVDSGEERTDDSSSAASRFAFLSEARSSDELGWLGPYRIRGVLGEGGMGIVFDAEDSQLCRRVALKILKPELAQKSLLRERFLQEARAAAALPTDHVVSIYQVNSEGDVPYLAMQYLEGESLEQYLKRVGRIPAAEAARLGSEIALGLSVAHDKGLIHRDIKPANIWLEAMHSGAAPRVKLLDFGLARAVGTVSNLTASGIIVGTPHYMAPEQARGMTLDHRCDLFSLGCVLYVALTGVKPFDGSDLLSLLTSLAVDEPRPIPELAPATPVKLVELIRELLSKSPDQRPTTAHEVAERLRALESVPTLIVPSPVVATTPKMESRTRAAKSRTNHFGMGLFLGSVLAAMIVLLGVWAWIKLGSSPPKANVDCSLQAHPIPVGVLQSLSGPLASTSDPIVEATQLAIDEINQQGGVLGSRIEPIFVDVSSDVSAFAAQANRLILENHVCALFGCCSPVARKHALAVIEKHDNLLFYLLPCEGLEESPNVIYLAAAPNQQIRPLMQFAAGTLSKKRLFLVGSDDVYSRAVHAQIRDAVAEKIGVGIVGEEFFPLGNSDVNAAVVKISASQADLIINTISGDTNEVFYRALRDSSVTSEKTPSISLTVSANELRTLPTEQRIGNYAVRSYFQSVNRPENAAFVHKFQARFGAHRTLTDLMESAYVAVHLWARAVTEANETRPALVRQSIRGMHFNAPGGPMRIDPTNQYAWKIARLGRIDEGGQLKIVWSSEEPIQPEPFPVTRKRTEWLRFLDETHRDLGGRWGR